MCDDGNMNEKCIENGTKNWKNHAIKWLQGILGLYELTPRCSDHARRECARARSGFTNVYVCFAPWWPEPSGAVFPGRGTSSGNTFDLAAHCIPSTEKQCITYQSTMKLLL